jgi:hypothetical protein
VKMEEHMEADLVAKLPSCPKSLHGLWWEYPVGSPDVQVAKDFAERERGADKSKYHRMSTAWWKVYELI